MRSTAVGRRVAALRAELLEARDVPAVVPANVVAVGAAAGGPPVVTLIDPATLLDRRPNPGLRGRLHRRRAHRDRRRDRRRRRRPRHRPGRRRRAAGAGHRRRIGRAGAFLLRVRAVVHRRDHGRRRRRDRGRPAGHRDGDRQRRRAAGPHVRDHAGVDRPGRADDFFAYEDTFRGGVLVATADVDGDGIDEIVSGTGVGGGPRVRVVNRAGERSAELLRLRAVVPRPAFGSPAATWMATAGTTSSAARARAAGRGSGPSPAPPGRTSPTSSRSTWRSAAASRSGRSTRTRTAGPRWLRRRAAGRPASGGSTADGTLLGETALPDDTPEPPTDPTQLTAAEVDDPVAAGRGRVGQSRRDHRRRGPQRPHPRRARRERRRPPRSPATPTKLVFAIDGAVAKARTGAFFGNNQAPLTSRTVQFISQSHDHRARGEVEPEHHRPELDRRAGRGSSRRSASRGTSRRTWRTRRRWTCSGSSTPTATARSTPAPTASRARPTTCGCTSGSTSTRRSSRPGRRCSRPDSYGFDSGLLAGRRRAAASPRCRAASRSSRTGRWSAASASSSPGRPASPPRRTRRSATTFDPTRPDRSLEAEWIAFAAVGGHAGRRPGRRARRRAAAGRRRRAAVRPHRPGRHHARHLRPAAGPEGGLEIVQAVGRAVGRGDPNDGANRAGDGRRGCDCEHGRRRVLRTGCRCPRAGW